MFSRRKGPRKRSSSNSANNHESAIAASIASKREEELRRERERKAEASMASPLQMTFDFELSPSPALPSSFSPSGEPRPPPSLSPSSRPQTHDGPLGSPAAATSKTTSPTIRSPSVKSPVGLSLLPHIPQVASRNSSARSVTSREVPNGGRIWSGSGSVKSVRVREKDNGKNASSSPSTPMSANFLPGRSSPSTASKEQLRPKRSQSTMGSPRMEASLFPARNGTPESPSSPPLPPMNRSFIDSRDRPYGQPQRPVMLQQNHSSPNVLEGRGAVTSARQPTPIYSSKTSPRPSTQNHGHQSGYSGSTARPSTRASSHTAFSAGPIITVGTPYGETADFFPLPQHVMTRPKTPGAISQVAGVTIPTHHTSANKSTSKSEARKSQMPKKKGRLLLLLQRRRSSQDREVVIAEKEVREAQEQALARQKDVLASGVNKPPPDFDPRIKGKVVHDFSSPREKRNTFDELDMPTQLGSPMQSPDMAPPLSPTMYPPRNQSLIYREKRRSTHTAVFKENLDEMSDSSKRLSSINAENRENKDFLQRASQQSSEVGLSQESGNLPPFARRSQMLDPMQAAFYRDDDSKRSSDPLTTREHASLLSEPGAVSPATARSSNNTAISPVSPTSPFSSSRGVSQMYQGVVHDGTAHSGSISSKTSPPLGQNKHASEKLSRPTSAVLPLPEIDTVAVHSINVLPVESSARQTSVQESQVKSRDVAAHNADRSTPSPDNASQDLKTMSPTSRSLPKPTAETGSLEQTPELIHDTRTSLTESMQSTPTKLVEKRKSATGHSKRSSTLPKHNSSNASRFSFQFGESAAQEQALEEKHRKAASREMPQPVVRGTSPDEDEDDYFDEDAMDDMDELEMQASQEDLHLKPTVTLSSQPGDGSITHAGSSQSSLYLQQARQALHKKPSYSDDGSVYDDDNIPEITDEADIPYADHPAFRAHSALAGNSRHNSIIPEGGYWRDSTVDYYIRDSYGSSMRISRLPNDYLSVEDNIPGSNRNSRPRSDFYLHPSTSANSLSTPEVQQKPPLPHRDSGNSERNRVASGMNFSSPFATPSFEKAEPLQSSVNGTTPESCLDISNESSATDLPAAGGLYMMSSAARSVPDVNITPSSPTSQASHVGSRVASTPLSSALIQEKAEHDPKTSAQDGIRNESSGALSLISPVFDERQSDRVEYAAQAGHSQEDTRDGSVNASRTMSPAEITRHHRQTSSSLSFENFTKMGFGETSHLAHPSSSPPPSRGMEGDSRFPADSLGNSSSKPAPTGLGLSMHKGIEGIHDKQRISLSVKAQQYGASTATGTSDSEVARKPLPFARVGTSTSPSHRPFSNAGANSPSRFAGFKFQNSPPQQSAHSRIGSEHSVWSSRTARPANVNQSEAVGTASDGLGLSMSPDFDFDVQGNGEDEMYFDDGNLDLDVNVADNDRFNEDAFDDDNFLYRPNAAVNGPHGYEHRRIQSGSSVGEGPYPMFAIPNADKARARDSRMMLEDLPLQTPIDPRYIPQRNPSEDAKRFGVRDRAPPVPVMESNREAFMAMQDNLQRYHAALADAANRAAADGRFKRAPSVSSTQSTSLSTQPTNVYTSENLDAQSLNDDQSVYSHGEAASELYKPHLNSNAGLERSSTQAAQQAHAPGYSPHKLSFDFGFDQNDISLDDFDNDDDLVAAANAEALANDDEGFYGQEFQFYGRPRANSNELEAINGGYFGEDGDNGLQRNKSLREPNLTPITERSEFSTRNSFVGFLPGTYGPPSAAGFPLHSAALARMPVNPLMADDITSFDDLRRLRAQAFGGSKSNSNHSSQNAIAGPNLDTSTAAYTSGSPLGAPFSSPINSQQTSPGFPPQNFQTFQFHDSPQSATSSNGNPFPFSTADIDSTPKRHTVAAEPVTAKKISPPTFQAHVASTASPPTSPGGKGAAAGAHFRQGSGTEVAYVQEPDPSGMGKPRWVLERRTSDKGEMELVGRELVSGGWI